MATLKEQDVVLLDYDEDGNPIIQMPITRIENVEGAPKKVSLTGDLSASGAFDSTGNLSLVATLPNSNATAGSYGQSANTSPGHDGTFSVPCITIDEKGRVVGIKAVTITLPSGNNEATSSALGVVKIGSNISISSGTISLTKGNVTSALGYTPVNKAGDTVNGNLTITGTLKGATIQSTSDERLKEEFEPIGSALERLEAIEAFTYVFKADKSRERHAGVVAQQVQKVLPEAVKKDADGYYSVDYNGVLALALQAINELNKKVKELQNEQI